jgi:hypothetical protein
MSDDRQIVARGVKAAIDSTLERGELGKPIGNDDYEFEVDSDNDHVQFVKILRGDQGSTIVEAINFQCPRIATWPVLIDKTFDDRRIIVQTDWSRMTESLSKQFQGLVSPHNHSIGSGLDDSIEPRRLEMGQVYPTTTDSMVVRAETFDYINSNGPVTFEGSEIDLSADVPVTDNVHLWVLVAVNKLTNLITTVVGSEQINFLPLLKTDLLALATSDMIPLCGVELATGDTDLNDPTRFTPVQAWFGSGGVITDDMARLIFWGWR